MTPKKLKNFFMELSISEIDEILKHMKNIREGYYPLTPERVMKIKSVWSELHQYDSDNIYTFNDDFTIIRKEKRIIKYPPLK